MSKISVIIPVYNVEKFLRECLESVIKQTLEDIEILVINDCGKDNSLSIVEEFVQKDKRIKLIKHNENKGLAIARNTGLKHAKGEYIFFLDSDDYITSHILEQMYNKAKNTNADITVCRTKPFAEIETESIIKRVEKLKRYLDYQDNELIQITKNKFKDALDNLNCIACSKLFKKEFIDKNKLQFINGKFAHEDNGFHIKCLSMLPKISLMNETGYMYRIGELTITAEMNKKSNKKKKDFNLYQTVKDAVKYMEENLTKEDFRYFYSELKDSKTYSRFFDFKLGPILTLKWTSHLKRVRIFGIQIFKKKILTKTSFKKEE